MNRDDQETTQDISNKKENQETTENVVIGREFRPKNFSSVIYITFFWCMIGVSLIYGYRLWNDMPVHPTFMPIIGAVFSGILAFTLVIALEYVIGPIKLEMGEKFNFSGATGPIVFWCICFLAIIYGLYLLGLPEIMKDYAKQNEFHTSCSVGKIYRDECPVNQSRNKSSLESAQE
ncbi:MAG: hypothetical protein LZF64_02940 [Nitrosomonas sp.]|nr:hypothetical protein [Nitrosomonas sp.]UJP00757.1 MAG: hypothetical protein LZF64_02940 [Nitrosomonas sp.]